MGWKLAGFDVLGGVEIDDEMMSVYHQNFRPRYGYKMGVQQFKQSPKDALPRDLFELDVLDGSPPCSSFSMAGARERDWGKEKTFREGQAEQRLDDLFFHFIDVANILRPKIVVAENVKGLIQGTARGYVKEIFERFQAAGYETQLFLMNASRMGVPQARERTIFVARRNDLKLPAFQFHFNEPPIPLKKAIEGCDTSDAKNLPPSLLSDWHEIKRHGKGRYLSTSIAWPGSPCPTLTTKVTTAEGSVMPWDRPRKFSRHEVVRISTFPEDYDFAGLDAGYVCGMSVPPAMMQRIGQVVRGALLPPG